MELALKQPPSFIALFSIGPVQEALFGSLTTVELLLKVRALNRQGRQWVEAELLHAGGEDALGRAIRAADIASGIHVALLRRFAAVPGARVLLYQAVYELEGDVGNEQHLLNVPRGDLPLFKPDLIAFIKGPDGAFEEAYAACRDSLPKWREGYGPLQIAADVTLVGQEGTVLSGNEYSYAPAGRGLNRHLPVTSKGVSFVSMHFGVANGDGAANDDGVRCNGKLTATRCTVENNGGSGVIVGGELGRESAECSVELADSVIRQNRKQGVHVYAGKVMLRGGTIDENHNGVCAWNGAKVTVAEATDRLKGHRPSAKTARRTTGQRAVAARSSASRRRRSMIT